MDHRTHQPLRDTVAGIVVLAGKILLTDVAEDIINPSRHLVFRQCKGEYGIEDRKLREYFRPKHMADNHRSGAAARFCMQLHRYFPGCVSVQADAFLRLSVARLFDREADVHSNAASPSMLGTGRAESTSLLQNTVTRLWPSKVQV